MQGKPPEDKARCPPHPACPLGRDASYTDFPLLITLHIAIIQPQTGFRNQAERKPVSQGPRAASPSRARHSQGRPIQGPRWARAQLDFPLQHTSHPGLSALGRPGTPPAPDNTVSRSLGAGGLGYKPWPGHETVGTGQSWASQERPTGLPAGQGGLSGCPFPEASAGDVSAPVPCVLLRL